MTLDTSCLDGVLGLANCECPCLTDIAPDGYNDSDSGLYITDLVPIQALEGADRCADPANPWNVLSRGRTQGANMVLKDARAAIMKGNKPTRAAFTGLIGERSATTTLSLSTTYAGTRIMAPNIKGAKMRITKIGGVFSETGAVSVRIYDRFNQTHGAAVSISAVANTHVETACDITLDLWHDGMENCQYFFAYTIGAQPKATRAFCPSCASVKTPVFSVSAPYTTSRINWPIAQGWANWIQVGGWNGDSLASFHEAAENDTATMYMNGLTIRCEIVCDPVQPICINGIDYSDPVALSLVHAYRYASAIHVADLLIRSPQALQNALVARETLIEAKQEWWELYKEAITFVGQNISTQTTDCILCKPAFSANMQSKLP